LQRRTLLQLAAGAAATPLMLRAQVGPVIGFLHAGSPKENQKRLDAFRKGLAAGGFAEGRNVSIEYRWARGKNELLPELAADLVRHNAAVIATPGSTAAAVAAKKATSAIPVVFSLGTDPVGLGLVESLFGPEGFSTCTASTCQGPQPRHLAHAAGDRG
jgi:ABC-type uncharacterized transport system substrate-binding protein